ncbi:transcriptional regulator, IclR family [Celeribacter indicus]|nr:transcriptional regulator, IclR family [Celeribacter indicus]
MRLTRQDKDMSESRGIQSIEIGCHILRSLANASSAMALKDLAAASAMPPSKVRFYLVSFLREGIIVQDSATGHYSLGPFAVQLGLSALRQSDIVSVSREIMLGLRDATGLSVFLSIWGNRGPTIVQKFEGREHSPLNVRVGFGLPITSSPTGNIFCAYLPKSEVEPILKLEKSGLIWVGPKSRSLSSIATELAAIRERGYALSRNQLNEGYAALSVPIFDATGDLAGALSVLGSSLHFDNEQEEADFIDATKRAAAAISSQLGYPDPESRRPLPAGEKD